MKVLEMLATDEGVFDFVSQHLITQGQKSYGFIVQNNNKSSSCLYRSGNNLSCAVGCLIENKFYNDNLEFKVGDDQIVINAVQQSVPNWKINKKMLLALQELHDEYEPNEWEYRLYSLREEYFNKKELEKDWSYGIK